MSTVSPEPAIPTLAPVAAANRWKNLVALGLVILIVLFIAVAVPTLLAERAFETKRREIARAGGKCEINRVSPAWLKQIAGEDSSSFLDRSIIEGVNFSGEKIDDEALNSLIGLK